MLADFLKTFVVTTALFFLFFYSTPYWTGAGMENLMPNGVYHAFYVFCSKLGFWAYQLIELLSMGICSLIEGLMGVASKDGRPRSARSGLLIYTLLSLCLLAGSIVGLNQLYERLFAEMFAVGDGINVSSEHSLLSCFSDLLIFFKLTAGYMDGTFPGFFHAVGKALLMCAAYFWGTMVFFSFLYGLLRQKVVTLKGDGPDADLPQGGDTESLLDQCIGGVKDAVGNICYLRYFKVPGTLLPFLLIMAAYSLVRVLLGETAEFGELFMEILDSTGVVDIVTSFVISFIGGKIFYCVCIPIYHVLPAGFQDAFQQLSDHGRQWVQREKERRREWAGANDFLHNSGNSFSGLHPMDLFGKK